jgi:uncharacterized protein
MNHLQYETSPYLLQHANNPVDWHAWKPEAFAKARELNKPILVSIGYSTCHWCHVMEHESFENQQVAAYMNAHFVCIKVDREERPDVDQIYMEACQLITGQGGWPLNCFLLPDGRPFYAGTYYPPQPMYNRPSWSQVLQNISGAFVGKPEVVEDQANKLMEYIERSDKKLVNNIEGLEVDAVFDAVFLEKIYKSLSDRFDEDEGGFGGAPKFPGAMSLSYLAAHYEYTKDEDALDHLNLSLQKMIMGGIYDQLGGGFSRYATDQAWLIPHFEKMLYDNALLVSTLADAYRLTQNELYKTTIQETLDFVLRELYDSEGGFYAALDADSEGVEGKFYVWNLSEIQAILGEDAELFAQFYDVSEEGNWEEVNILWRQESEDAFCEKHHLDKNIFNTKINACKQKLMAVRDTRIRPGLDDKILLAWNAMMCSAFAAAYQAIGDERYKTVVEQNISFIEKRFVVDGQLRHTYKNGITQYDAFLDDYAFYILALTDAYQITFNADYLAKAKTYLNDVITNFYDPSDGLFFYTSTKQSDIVIRKKEMYDNATPSGNSSIALALARLSIYFDESQYQNILERMLLTMKDSVRLHSTSFSRWAQVMQQQTLGMREIVCVGEQAEIFAHELQKHYLPNTIYMVSKHGDETMPLLEGRYNQGVTHIYICTKQSCSAPLDSVQEALSNVKVF